MTRDVQWIELPWGKPYPARRRRQAVDKIERTVQALLAAHPPFAAAAARCGWILDTADDDDLAYASSLRGVPVIGVYAAAVERLDKPALTFTLAHELMHVRLGHADNQVRTGAVRVPTVQRMFARATEPLVNDQLAQDGIFAPGSLDLYAPLGADAFGFSLAGLNRAQIWQTVIGERSVGHLRDLARVRNGGICTDDSGWTDEMLAPPRPAVRFWAQRFGAWQTRWQPAHDRLVDLTAAARKVTR